MPPSGTVAAYSRIAALPVAADPDHNDLAKGIAADSTSPLHDTSTIISYEEGVGTSLTQPSEVEKQLVPAESKRVCNRAAGRLLLVVVFFAGLIAAVKLTGIDGYLSRERVLGLMKEAGPLGWIAFIFAFAIGELIHVPGIVFVAAGVYSYGPVVGGVLAYCGSVLSVSMGFLLTRGLSGGTTLDQLGLAWINRATEWLSRAPVVTVAVLRLVFYLMPVFNQSMALTNISFASYMLGSLIGIAPMTVLTTLLLDKIIALDFVALFKE